MTRLIFDPVFPLPLILGGGILLLILSCYFGAKLSAGLPTAKRVVLLLLRSLGICLLLLLLLQPSQLVPEAPQMIDDVTWIGIDTSKSMLQKDADGKTRIDAAIDLLREEILLPSQVDATRPALRFFGFDEQTEWTKKPEDLVAEGSSTRIHDVLTEAAGSANSSARTKAIFLLTDGHDFQLVSPARTGFASRSRRIPIYAVPFGSAGNVRDAATRISGYPPLAYVKQKARIQAAIRLIGCKFEELECQLLRSGRLMETKRIDTDQKQQVFVDFDVIEEEVGQYEYEIRTVPLNNESDTKNNSAITYLNVVDQQINVLLLEADPYWDTTFLQRSLRANEKFNIVAFIQYADSRVHCITNKKRQLEPVLPMTAADFSKYDVVILGRKINDLLDPPQLKALESYVREKKGTVVFSRGTALTEDEKPLGIEPVVWGDSLGVGGTLQASRAGNAAAPFALLTNTHDVPNVIDAFNMLSTKSLASNMAGLQEASGVNPLQGFVHRRVGQGQVLAIGVTGMWRWAINKNSDGSATFFDRFWDQLLLWLLSSRDVLSDEQFVMRINSANILYGNKIYFRVLCRDEMAPKGRISISVQSDRKEKANLSLAFKKVGMPLTTEWLPPVEGKYTAIASFPNGKKGKLQFIVYRENAEETEVAVDTLFLKRICNSSGGELLAASELNKRIRTDGSEHRGVETKHQKRTLWDRRLFFYMIGIIFGLEWFLRRRVGLC